MKTKLYSVTLLFFLFRCIFQTQAQNPNWGWALPITVTQSGSNLTCSVFDPVLNQTKTTNITGSSYVNSEGVIAVVDNGNKVTWAIYDRNLHTWKDDYNYISSSSTINLSNVNGVVGYVESGNKVSWSTYDPFTKAWVEDYNYISSSSSITLKNQDGVIAYIESGNKVNWSVYDPSSHSWIEDYNYISSSSSITLTNSNGIVAYVESGNKVNWSIYNPSSHSWIEDYNYISSSSSVILKNQNGVVAYVESGNKVNWSIFDPSSNSWIEDYDYISGAVSNFTINDGTVNFYYQSTNYKYGFSKNTHSWQSNYNTDLYCKLFIVNATTNPNRIIYVWCLTYGANSFSYNCGDGHTITNRWAWKQYNNSGNYTPVLSIFNSNSNSTCNESINFAPTGIEDLLNDIDIISIYPNPSTNGKFEISSKKNMGNTTIDLFDVTGNLVYTEKTSIFANENKQVNIGSLANGIYTCKISNSDEYFTKKIIVE